MLQYLLSYSDPADSSSLLLGSLSIFIFKIQKVKAEKWVKVEKLIKNEILTSLAIFLFAIILTILNHTI